MPSPHAVLPEWYTPTSIIFSNYLSAVDPAWVAKIGTQEIQLADQGRRRTNGGVATMVRPRVAHAAVVGGGPYDVTHDTASPSVGTTIDHERPRRAAGRRSARCRPDAEG
jgi:hypothetical protein